MYEYKQFSRLYPDNVNKNRFVLKGSDPNF
jgi:hypothetical protein